MNQRFTIMLDEDIARRVRKKQAKAILKLNKSVPFSEIINQCLEYCLKKWKNNLLELRFRNNLVWSWWLQRQKRPLSNLWNGDRNRMIIQAEKMYCDTCQRSLSVANKGTNHVISIICPDCMEKWRVNFQVIQ